MGSFSRNARLIYHYFLHLIICFQYPLQLPRRFKSTLRSNIFHRIIGIVEHGAEFGGDTSRMLLMGNSAGANLAAVVTQKAKQDGLVKKIKLQVLNGLPADLSAQRMETSPSYQENASGYFLTKASCYFSMENYAPGVKNNPELSPILTKDISGLPPAVIISAEFDPLRDDAILYADKLRKAGVKVWDKCFAGQIHMLLGLPPNAKEIKELETMVKDAMKECF